jgi:hypothetical protein
MLVRLARDAPAGEPREAQPVAVIVRVSRAHRQGPPRQRWRDSCWGAGLEKGLSTAAVMMAAAAFLQVAAGGFVFAGVDETLLLPPKWYNQTYSYPDGAGALIIEGPFPYKNGPAVWSDETPFGAYGMVVIPGTFDKEDPEAACTPVPASSPFAHPESTVYPVKLTNGIHDCLLGCNWTEVSRSGVDPCHAGSLPMGLGLSNSVMSCFNLGPGTEGHGGGACGYNCSLLQPHTEKGKLVPCTKADSTKCQLFCDTRTFPRSR